MAAEGRTVNPLVEQFQRGGVPRELRLMGAQGALPLKPADLVDLLQLLARDPDAEVAQAATGSLKAMPKEELAPIVKDRLTPPVVLAWVLANREERELREPALQNPATPDEAIESIVGRLPDSLAELVVINQVRLLRRISLLEALEANTGLNNDQKRRLRELRETFHIGEVAPAQTAAPAPELAAPEAEPEAEPEPESATVETTSLTEEEAVSRYLTNEEKGETEKVSAVQRIFRLNTAQKVVQALKGTKEDRAILVRDPNRLVATAVIGSPRLTDAEVEAFAAMRNISDEILRRIARNKDWTKKYSVVASLVKNPRTPLGVSLGMISRLNPRDLKGLSVDKNVSEAVRRAAKRFVKEPGQSSGGGAKH
ncbi:MAG TPA: hypothetical protein VGQ78_05595 [Vicinamibacteria bacterium]|nr:hypothetical protein [Vicinamibacteria bacterium]